MERISNFLVVRRNRIFSSTPLVSHTKNSQISIQQFELLKMNLPKATICLVSLWTFFKLTWIWFTTTISHWLTISSRSFPFSTPNALIGIQLHPIPQRYIKTFPKVHTARAFFSSFNVSSIYVSMIFSSSFERCKI